MVLAPFLLWRAALTIAHGLAFPTAGEDSPQRYMDPKAEEMARKQLLHSRILTSSRPLGRVFHSSYQGSVFYMFAGSIHVNVFAFSAACSLGVIAMALISLPRTARKSWTC